MNESTSIIPQIESTTEDIKSGTDNYDAMTLSEQNVKLSRLYGNLTSEIARLEHDYDVLRKNKLDNDFDMPVNKLDIITKSTEEYYKLKNAQGVEKALIQLIRANNRLIRIKENEQSVSRFQG
jgi:hypothetical protein